VCLCVATFAPILDNGFIADDYVFLEDVDRFKTEPLFLFEQAPLNFRMTTFLLFFLFKTVAGYTPVVFYAFTIAVHIVNCVLLWNLLLLLGRENLEAYIAAVLFAVFHAPQEAVMWLVAMGEALQGFCVLAILVLWLQKRYAVGLLIYCVALFTKESAPMVMIFLALLQWYRRERIFTTAFLWYSLPTAAFAAFFIWMWAGNSFIQGGAYAFGPQALSVLVLSIHRLLWPFFYIVLLGSGLGTGKWMKPDTVVKFLGLVAIAMLPYIFLTYSKALPSRHVYLASMVLVGAMACLIAGIRSTRWRRLFLVGLVGYNLGYAWIRKDAQFEERAAPTDALVKALRMHPPQPTLILDFAYPFPQIAKAASRAVPGWNPELISVEEPCDTCMKLRWDSESRTYRTER
jgi:hypothetical protein